MPRTGWTSVVAVDFREIVVEDSQDQAVEAHQDRVAEDRQDHEVDHQMVECLGGSWWTCSTYQV